MEKFTGNSIQEFRKWAAENWKEIEAAFEEICEKYLEEQRENLTDYSLPSVNASGDWTFVQTDCETVFALPNPKDKPIKNLFCWRLFERYFRRGRLQRNYKQSSRRIK